MTRLVSSSPVLGGVSASRRIVAGKLVAAIDHRFSLFFLLPAVLLVIALAVYPFIYTLLISTRSYDLTLANYNFVGIDNYVKALTGQQFWAAFGRSVILTTGSVIISVSLGLVMALILNRDFSGARWARTAFLLPMVATPVATSLVWMMMFNPTLGVLNYILELVGLPPSLWVADPNLVLACIILVDVWHAAPFAMIILLAGLKSLPSEPIESAMIDGASRLQVFRHVILPMLQPVLIAVVIFRTIDSLKAFDTIWVITAGGPGTSSETLYIYAYNQAFKYLDLGYGSAVILIFAAIVAGASVAWAGLREREWR